MASGTVGRKTYSSTSASNLDNNLDALLDDLQTSIGRSDSFRSSSVTRNHARHEESKPQHNTTTRIIETSRHSPMRGISPLRSPSPSGRTCTVEKYVSTGPAGTPSGIPGLEMLDKELQDVQPGQSKTVAYKQVSYHYDKQQDGKDLEPWIKTDKITSSNSRNDASIVDNFCERTFEKSGSSLRSSRDTPDYTTSSRNNKEIIYKADVSTKTIPAPQPITHTIESRQTERDFKYSKETRTHTEPSPISPRKVIKTVRTDETEDLTNVEYIPSSTPIPPPGPNTKVTKTVKTYTYELPPTVTSLPRETEKTVHYHVDRQLEEGRTVREYIPPPSPSMSRVHREEKVYVERRLRQASPPPPVTTTSSHTRSEKYLQQSRGYSPSPPSVDYPDHSSSTVTKSERIIYQNEAPPPRPAPPPETRTTVRQYEEHYSSNGRPPKPTYYPESHHSSSTHVYKYDESSSAPRPFPTSESPAPRQQPPRRIEDLMASFSESEHEVFENKGTRKEIKKEVEFSSGPLSSMPPSKSRNVSGPPVYYPPGSAEFASKREMMAGGGEYGKKEESLAMNSKANGQWAKERAAWEYGASNRSEEKQKTKKTVVPACLPLCCALPCVIM